MSRSANDPATCTLILIYSCRPPVTTASVSRQDVIRSLWHLLKRSMSCSTSETAATPSTSSGLSPQALLEKHRARQGAGQNCGAADQKTVLKRLCRLSNLQQDGQRISSKPQRSSTPSSCREPACRPDKADEEATESPEAHAQAQHAEAGSSRQQACNNEAAKPMPTHARQKAGPQKHMRGIDAPRHLADPLSSKPQAPKKRSISEVLHLFKGKVSRALAQRKHLRPARLEDANGPTSKGKGMNPQQQQQQHPQRLDGRHRTAAADEAAAQAKRPLQEEAQRVRAKLLKKKQAARVVNDQVRKACCCCAFDIWKWKQPPDAQRHFFPFCLLTERAH